MSDFLTQQMRLGMRRLASGVSVVTSKDKSGKRLAMTASSVTSLTDDPASLLVCIHRESYLSKAIQENGKFCISVLAKHHREVSIRCSAADSTLDRFALGDWQENSENGLYYLQDALSVFHCGLEKSLEYGTHFVFVGNIESVKIQGEDISPLVYVDGQYVQVAD